MQEHPADETSKFFFFITTKFNETFFFGLDAGRKR
jgi:hypothetical protein